MIPEKNSIAPFKRGRLVPAALRALSLRLSVAAALCLTLIPEQSAAAESEEKAQAEQVIDQCVADHVSSQRLRKSGRLLKSQELAYQCAASHCPGQLRIDCLGWINQLSAQVPSLSFQVTVEGHREANAQVFLDNKLVLKRLTGKALPVDPGSHAVRVEADGFAPYSETIVINEGEQFRTIVAEFLRPAPPPPPSPAPDPPPATPQIHTVEWVLAGAGVLATGSAIGWGLYATSGRNQLESECAPLCQPASVTEVKRRGLVADVSMGIGLASFVGAAVVYFSRSETQVPLEVTVRADGGVVGSVRGKF